MTREQLVEQNRIDHPYLDPDDPKLAKTPVEIITDEIDLQSDSILTEAQRPIVMDALEKNLKVFSCYNEIIFPF